MRTLGAEFYCDPRIFRRRAGHLVTVCVDVVPFGDVNVDVVGFGCLLTKSKSWLAWMLAASLRDRSSLGVNNGYAHCLQYSQSNRVESSPQVREVGIIALSYEASTQEVLLHHARCLGQAGPWSLHSLIGQSATSYNS